jgi:hypothetical protein
MLREELEGAVLAEAKKPVGAQWELPEVSGA